MKAYIPAHMQARRRVIYALLAMIAVLFVSIYVGVSIGDRIRGLAQNQAAEGTDLPTPVPNDGATYEPAQNGWKRVQVVAIATDPGFPDPRITPTPEPPSPSPSPTPKARPMPVPPSTKPGQNPALRPIWESTFAPDVPIPPAEEMPSAAPSSGDVGN